MSIKNLQEKLKEAYPQAIVSLTILCVNLMFFGLNNIIIAPYMTLTFIRMKNYLTIEKNIFKPLFIHLFIGVLASVASDLSAGTFIINLIAVFVLAYFLTDEYNPSSYFPYLMAFVFLQIFPTSIHEIPRRLLAIFVSYIIVFIALRIISPRGVHSKIFQLIKDGMDNISIQLELIINRNFKDIKNKQYELFEICKELNRFVYSSGKKKYYPFIIVFHHMINIVSELVENKDNLNEKSIKNLRKLFLNFEMLIKNKRNYSNMILDFCSKNSFNNEEINYYIHYMLNYYSLALIEAEKSNKEGLKRYLNFKDSKEYFKKYSKYNFSLNGFKIRFSIRLALLIAISFSVEKMFSIPKGYWIPMTIFILTLPFYEDSKIKVKQRFNGTILGLCISFILFSIFTGKVSHIIILIITTFLMYAFSDYGTMTIYLTCYSLAITTISMGDNEAIILRFLYTAIAAVTVLFANNFILKNRNHIELITMINKLIELDKILLSKIKDILNGDFNKSELRLIIYSSYLISGKLEMHYSKRSNENFKKLLLENNQLVTLLAHNCIIFSNENKHNLNKIYIEECISNINDIFDYMEESFNNELKEIKDYCININNIRHKESYENILLLKCLKKASDVSDDLINLKKDL